MYKYSLKSIKMYNFEFDICLKTASSVLLSAFLELHFSLSFPQISTILAFFENFCLITVSTF